MKKQGSKVVSAGIIVFRKSKEGTKFLVLYHGRGYWNFPKGKLEASERSWQAAIREVQEETGLKKNELRLVGNFKAFEKFHYKRGKDNIFKVVILYLAQTHQSKITLSEEHQGYGWFSFSEAKKMLGKHKDSVKILEKANNYLVNFRRKNREQKTQETKK
ncbi:MAG: NUDIX domain-containing protein [Candidatus Paceibacterota bacterium]